MNRTQPKPTVTVIPATVDKLTAKSLEQKEKKRVAAYARVSTDSDEQLESFDAQVAYYTKHIKNNPDWKFVRVYADEAITATNTKHRKEFNEMVEDALRDKIDLIITKSVSRFARNTVDTLTTVRKLKEKGVEVYFEKENIRTLDSKGELLITIMSSIAQEESRSISENVTWGQRKRMADGKVSMPYGQFLGYTKGEDGNPKIVEEEAVTVREIYALFLDGNTYREIVELLTGNGIPTPSKRKVWSVSTVRSILQNEKYAGNAILQKQFTVDFLTKKRKTNEGEVPQYYVENSHPAIVSETDYNLVQDEIKRRSTLGKKLSGRGLFFGKIICGQCGALYGSKVWHSTDKYRRKIWQCNGKYTDKSRATKSMCHTPHITEDTVKDAFVEAIKILIANKAHYRAETDKVIASLSDTAPFDAETAALHMACAEAAAEADACIAQNANTPQDQTEYKKRYDELVAKYDTAKQKLETLEREKRERKAKKEKLCHFQAFLRKTDTPPTTFDESLWRATVESLTVCSENNLLFTFRGGVTVRVEPKQPKSNINPNTNQNTLNTNQD